MSRVTSSMIRAICPRTSASVASVRMARLPQAMSKPTPEMEINSLVGDYPSDGLCIALVAVRAEDRAGAADRQAAVHLGDGGFVVLTEDGQRGGFGFGVHSGGLI